jgi:hypothetical protein
VATPKTTISLDDFRVRAAHTGMTLTEEDIVPLHKGFLGMLELMERIPADWVSEAEPSQIFRPLVGTPR